MTDPEMVLRARCGKCLARLVDGKCPDGHSEPLTDEDRREVEETIRNIGGHARTDLPAVRLGSELLLIWRVRMRPILERMRDEAPVDAKGDFSKVMLSTESMLEVLADWNLGGPHHGKSV